jgi:Xaa-Pro dipeptidase
MTIHHQTPLDKLNAFLIEKDLDGVLLRSRRNFSWVTGGKVNHIVNTTEIGVADLILFRDKKLCIVTKMESARIHDEELKGLGYEFITPEWYEGSDSAIMEICAGKRVGSDMPFEGLTDISRELATLRYSLNEEEIERYRWLSQKAAKAVEATCREIEPSWTEHEVAAHLAAKVMKDGINPHVILVSTDDRIYKYRHPIPTDKKLQSYAMVVICAEKWGLVSNVTRFVHFGPLPVEIHANRLKLVQIDIAMNSATRPGVQIRDVFQTGIDTYGKVGHAEDWRFLHQGGPTGYAPREFLAGPKVEGVVQVNQAFAWNPAIRGIKSEDTILVRETGNEFLTHTGEWVYIEIEQDGVSYLRPDILVR